MAHYPRSSGVRGGPHTHIALRPFQGGSAKSPCLSKHNHVTDFGAPRWLLQKCEHDLDGLLSDSLPSALQIARLRASATAGSKAAHVEKSSHSSTRMETYSKEEQLVVRRCIRLLDSSYCLCMGKDPNRRTSHKGRFCDRTLVSSRAIGTVQDQGVAGYKRNRHVPSLYIGFVDPGKIGVIETSLEAVRNPRTVNSYEKILFALRGPRHAVPSLKVPPCVCLYWSDLEGAILLHKAPSRMILLLRMT